MSTPGPPPEDERTFSILVHLLGLTSLLSIPGFIGPLIVYLSRRHLGTPSVDHAREALNFNLSLALYTVAGIIATVVLAVGTLGIALFILIPAWAAFGVFAVVCPGYAAYQTAHGRWWSYPLTIRFISR